jgi:hypothetical protein
MPQVVAALEPALPTDVTGLAPLARRGDAARLAVLAGDDDARRQTPRPLTTRFQGLTVLGRCPDHEGLLQPLGGPA